MILKSPSKIVENYKESHKCLEYMKIGQMNEIKITKYKGIKYKDNSMARSVTASSFFNNTPIFKELTKNNCRNRFSLKFNKQDGCYIFNVIPAFEISKKPTEIPGDITGIYKCFNKNKNVLYIGKGNIKSRIKEHLGKEDFYGHLGLAQPNDGEKAVKKCIEESVTQCMNPTDEPMVFQSISAMSHPYLRDGEGQTNNAPPSIGLHN